MARLGRILHLLFVFGLVGSGISTSFFSLPSFQTVYPSVKETSESLECTVGAPLSSLNGGPALLWNKSWGGSEEDLGNKILVCDNDGFAVAGYTRSYGSGDWDFLLLRTDSNGTHLWHKTYDRSGYDVCQSAFLCDDEGFVLVGETWNETTDDLDIWIVRTDNSGNYLWDSTFGGDGLQRGWDVVECANGDFVILAAIQYMGSGYEVAVYRTDADGNLLWAKTYEEGYAQISYQIVECNSGGFAFIGGVTQQSGYSYPWLVRIDAEGKILWSETYPHIFSSDGVALVECVDGGFAFVNTLNRPSNSTVWLYRTDENGSQQWDYEYGFSNNTVAHDLFQCKHHGFTLLGSIWNGTDYFYHIFRTSYNGTLFWEWMHHVPGYLGQTQSMVDVNGESIGIGGSIRIGGSWDDVWIMRILDDAPTPPPTDPFIPISPYLIFGVVIGVLLIIVGFLVLTVYWRRRLPK